MKLLANRKIIFKEISRSNHTFSLSATEITNPFNNLNYTNIHLAKIEESAIDESFIEEEYKRYIPYLYKVAEIMQKDPDCEVIEYIDFSNNSTIENPIIFVNFQEKNRPSISNSTKRFTLKEIDNIYNEHYS